MNHPNMGDGGKDGPAEAQPNHNDDTQGDDQGGKETIPDATPATGDDG